MNNRNGMFTSLLSLGAVSATVFGIVRGMRNGTLQPFLQSIQSSLLGSAVPQPVQGMVTGQAAQSMTKPLQGMMNNQGSQQQSFNQKPSNTKQSIANPDNNQST